MTSPASQDSLEAMPLPEGALILSSQQLEQASSGGWQRQRRGMALLALHQAMAERQVDLPLGPVLDPEEPSRLLSLNGFAVQLAITGLSSDHVIVELAPWRLAGSAPQLLLVAAVDGENSVVHFPGVLTGAEFLQAMGSSGETNGVLELDLAVFQGGVDRLLVLVQVLDPHALPRLALRASPPGQVVVKMIDWLSGRIDSALAGLGAELVPVTAGAFRSSGLAGSTTDDERALAILAIPLGLAGDQLVYGDQVARCIERFRLLLIASGGSRPEALLLRLVPDLAGDLLPEGLEITAQQGSLRQSVSSADSLDLQLSFPASTDLIDVALRSGQNEALILPTLQFPDSAA
jgi:hypothetical protein